jgi:hypothetical protein
MSKLDREWSISQITFFLSATEQVGPVSTERDVFLSTVMRGSDTEVYECAHVVEQILDRVLPQWKRQRPSEDPDYRWLREQAVRAQVTIEREEELAEKLGDNAPEMDAGKLHPWVWESARPMWNTGHYQQAVAQAAVRINAEAQNKLSRRDLSEVKLFNEAFSVDPPKPGVARLRLAEDDGGDTYKNLHRGARALADSLYTAIRNPAVHEVGDGNGGEEQLAL